MPPAVWPPSRPVSRVPLQTCWAPAGMAPDTPRVSGCPAYPRNGLSSSTKHRHTPLYRKTCTSSNLVCKGNNPDTDIIKLYPCSKHETNQSVLCIMVFLLWFLSFNFKQFCLNISWCLRDNINISIKLKNSTIVLNLYLIFILIPD